MKKATTPKLKPTPRKGNYWSNPVYRGETWLEGESDYKRRGYLRFPDGKLRVVTMAGTSDSPGSIEVYSHKGYASAKKTQWNHEGEFVFMPYKSSQEQYGSWD